MRKLLFSLSLGLASFGFSQTSNCDSLVIDCCNYELLGNDTISLTTQNNATMEIFSYPGFLLLDSNGDTLAMETVNFFGIGSGPQTHYLNVMNPINFPINGTLQLWGGFYDTLYCEFPVSLVGTSELEVLQNIQIYPNPVEDVISLQGIEEGYYSLFDVAGNLIRKDAYFTNSSIDLAEMSSGLYLLQIKPISDGVGKSLKFIKD